MMKTMMKCALCAAVLLMSLFALSSAPLSHAASAQERVAGRYVIAGSGPGINAFVFFVLDTATGEVQAYDVAGNVKQVYRVPVEVRK